MRRLFKVGSDRHDVGRVTFAWHPDGNFLASAGKNGIVHITDRHGEIVDEIPMTSTAPIISLAWDKDGDYLAILQDENGVVPLWSLSSRRVVPLETNLRDPTFLAWSKTGPQLAIGTAKGNLLIYNKSKKQKIPIVGKHGKKITCGAWSSGGNKLVLGSDDRTLTISNEIGDTLLHTELKSAAFQTHFTYQRFSESRSNNTNRDDNAVSANLSGRSILLYNIKDDNEQPMELTFAQRESGSGCKFGEIVNHQWIDEGLIAVGFSLGHLLVVSTSPKDMGDEKHSGKFHTNSLTTFAYNIQLKRIASAGDDGVRVIDVRDFRESKEDYIPPEDLEDGRITHLCWSPDGQILTIGTMAGNVYNFLAKMSVLNAKYKSAVGYLSSLREVSIVDTVRRSRPVDVMLKLEPSLIALGAKHIAAGMNNRVYYHRIAPSTGSQQINEQEYIGTLYEVQLNDSYAAVLTDTKATLHPIEPSANSQQQTRTFPGREEGSYAKVTCISLTDDFLYYGTEAGTVEMFYLKEWVMLAGAELRLDNSIKKLVANNSGTRVVVVDSSNQVFLYNPVTGGGVNQSITRFDSAPQNVASVLWDLKDKNVIMLYDGKLVHTYVYVQASMKGTLLIKLGTVLVSADGEIQHTPGKIEVTPGNIPIMSVDGVLTCQTMSGNITTIVHPYFDHLSESTPAPQSTSPRKAGTNKAADTTNKQDKKFLTSKFCQAIALLKLEIAWLTALQLDRRQFWLALSGKAMEMLNVELACRVYRQLGDAGMVMALEQCRHVEDQCLLAGHISLLFSDYQRAQDLFLSSSRPTAALEMRRDLLQWDQALKLAQALSQSQIPEICVQYGQQLEFRGEIDNALKMFESALNAGQDMIEAPSSPSSSLSNNNNNNAVPLTCPEALVPIAMMGVSRCNMKLGNIRQGIRLAQELDDKQLFADCGDILEQQKQFTEAAAMYLKGLQYEKAAIIYTKHLIKADKSKITEAAAIMEKVQNDHLHSAFAKACFSVGRFEEAARAYECAKDMDKVIELKLRNLDQVQAAFDLVRGGCSGAQGAQLVAEYCQEMNDFRGAIEFLLLANKSDDAFKLAQANSLVETYTSVLGESIGSEDALRVAHHYEKCQDYGKAGRYFSACGQYSKALKLFIQCGDREIDSAIEVVGKSQNESLTHQLIDFLVGEKDGVPKDPNYIYRLYMALKKYDDAAKTALIIARQEQDMGNYSLAHSVVVETIRQLEDSGIKVPLQLRQMFVLLHSYELIKAMVRRKDHSAAARLLLRVAQSASKFPMHVVPILSSTVIECLRAGLKVTGYEYAVMLMRAEYRQAIDPSIKKTIEGIVRKRKDVTEDPAEDASPCPISGELTANTQLECPTTRDALPMCVITGRHMVLEDWCFCPVSKFPAIYSEYVQYIETEVQSIASQSVDNSNHPETKSSSSPNAKSSRTTTVPDMVLRKPVCIADLKLATAEEATKYIQRYNNVFEEKKSAAAGADAAGEDDAKSPGDSTSPGKTSNPAVSDDKQPSTGGGGGGGVGVKERSSGRSRVAIAPSDQSSSDAPTPTGKSRGNRREKSRRQPGEDSGNN